MYYIYEKVHICVYRHILYIIYLLWERYTITNTLQKEYTDREYNSVSIAVDCLGADEAMNIVSKLKEVIELERYYKVKGRKAIVLMQSPNKKTPYFWIQVGFSTSY